jgi:predicted transposase/invertase (TIGR01784 family)
MLSVSLLKETRVYQEIKEEIEGQIREENTLQTKLEIVQKLLQKDMSIQEVAELVGLDEETVRKTVK